MYDIIKNIWTFIQTEILGMQWLNRLIGNVLELLGLDIESRIGGRNDLKRTALLCVGACLLYG